ncbi:MAG: regulatory signaling modulator protein AmpE [Gammaproteobacteria bacterium]|nr:regulatory signaling modulator protein AmpE [Gammaproteobacteria bacterium]TVQ43967.1 MAG: regulatory signaling modulator protein AmpE [Gammaproteobacteria bacterium]
MKLIALVVALVLERSLTRLLHLRELRWFDRYFDWALARLGTRGGWRSGVLAAALLLLPVLPVALVSIGLLKADIFWDVPYFLFAVLVLLFSLGPRDLGAEVQDYCDQVAAGDEAEATRTARQLLETEVPRDYGRRDLAVEEAVLVQANNRIFGVLLFFIAFGPIGAWLFRVGDLFRRRAVFEAGRREAAEGAPPYALIERLHGALAWVPARLTCLGYALAGSFEEAIGAWREYREQPARRFYDVNDELVATVGRGALARSATESPVLCVGAALRLVQRTVFVWVTAIALMTLFGWAI